MEKLILDFFGSSVKKFFICLGKIYLIAKFAKNLKNFSKVFPPTEIPSAKCRQQVEGFAPYTKDYKKVLRFFAFSQYVFFT